MLSTISIKCKRGVIFHWISLFGWCSLEWHQCYWNSRGLLKTEKSKNYEQQILSSFFIFFLLCQLQDEMRENELLLCSINQHQWLSKPLKIALCPCAAFVCWSQQQRTTHAPLVTCALVYRVLVQSMASILWSYNLVSLLPNAISASPPCLERPFWNLRKSLHLKSLCSFHKRYSLTLPDPRFSYLPYENEPAIMKYTAVKCKKKKKLIISIYSKTRYTSRLNYQFSDKW